MAKRTPKHVKIGPSKVVIVKVDPILDSASDGNYHHDEQRIEYSSKVKGMARKYLVAHEVIHALIDFIGFDFGSAEEEERFALSFAPAFVMFLRDNERGLVAWLLDD